MLCVCSCLHCLVTPCSYECGEHERKAKKRKEELEETVASKRSQRAELTGEREERGREREREGERERESVVCMYISFLHNYVVMCCIVVNKVCVYSTLM